jgi:hypothetical protein
LSKQHPKFDVWAIAVVALATALRLIHLGEIPSCLEYDEAANVILAGEIAQGKAYPIFIRPYTGKEVLYFYLAAGVMKLAGVTPFALRLTSVGCGILGVALVYWIGHELGTTGGFDERKRRWLALFSAGLTAVSYWQVNLSRFGYRAIVLPPLLALTVGFALRGLRTGQRKWPLLAGASAGLSAYTYSSVRVFPILLLLLWSWVLAGALRMADHRRWRLYLAQLALFCLAALVVFGPLGVFFLRHPETFSVRLDQVSVFSPSVNRGDLRGTLKRTVRLAFGVFTVAGDMNPLYNLPGRPIFDRIVGPFFYVGLLTCAWRLLFKKRGISTSPTPDTIFWPRLPYFLLLVWLAVMMVPNILSASGVPHNLRAMALVPSVFIVAALGVVVFAQSLGGLVAHVLHKDRFRRYVVAAILTLLLAQQGMRTYDDYVRVWAGSAGPYYKGNKALIHAADLINDHPEADPYVATYFYQHATLAVTAHDYARIRWMSGRTLILSPPDARPALLIYDHTNPIDPLLRDRYLPPDALLQRELGPDGEVAFEAYWVHAQKPGSRERPDLSPDVPMRANLGHTLTFLGYDLNAPAVSGDTLDVTLYVEVLREVDRDDWTFFAHLVDDLGFRWGGETFFYYPSAQWRPGEVMLFRLQLPIAPGAPPGEYVLDIGVFAPSIDARLPVLNEAGQMAGTAVSAGPIHVERAAMPPIEWPPIQRPQKATFGNTLTFLGSDRDRGDLRPGETLALALYWQTTQTIGHDYRVSVWLSGANSDVSLWSGHPVHGLYPFALWEVGEFVRDRYALRLPTDTLAGDFDLRLALLAEDDTPLVTSDGKTWLSLGTIHVHATDRLWEAPAFEHPVGTRLDDKVDLLGYDLDRDRVAPGEALHLTLIWRCRDTMDVAYTVFTHLLDQSERVRGQKDNPPVTGSYPTTLWVPGEIVIDPYEILVAADAEPGKYVIEVGMYDPRTVRRLPVFDPSGAVGDRILLATVHVDPRQE